MTTPSKNPSLLTLLLLALAAASLGAPARVVAGSAGPPVFQVAPVQSVIVGRVWVDANADRVFDRGERPLPGVLVLLSQGGEVFNEAVTDEQGAYRFDELEPGTYEVAVDDATLPPEYRDGPPLSNTVNLPGDVEFTQNFRIEEVGAGGPGVTPPGAPSVRLDANPDALTEGGSVTFTVTVEPPVEGVEYVYFFGDGGEVRSPRPQAQHVYERSGVFPAYVQLAQNGDPFAESPQIRIAVAPDEEAGVPPPVEVAIRAEPQRAEAGEPVVFTVTVEPPVEAVEYRFHFGDAEPTAWSGEATAMHAYAEAGAYDAFVEVRGVPNAPQQVASAPVLVDVVAPAVSGGGVPLWLILVGVLLLLLVGGYVLTKRGKSVPPAAKMAVEPEPDTTPEVATDRPPALDVEVRLRPVRDVGSHRADGSLTIEREIRHAE